MASMVVCIGSNFPLFFHSIHGMDHVPIFSLARRRTVTFRRMHPSISFVVHSFRSTLPCMDFPSFPSIVFFSTDGAGSSLPSSTVIFGMRHPQWHCDDPLDPTPRNRSPSTMVCASLFPPHNRTGSHPCFSPFDKDREGSTPEVTSTFQPNCWPTGTCDTWMCPPQGRLWRSR